MATLLESSGCTLPVLDPSTPVLHQQWQYRAAAKAGLRSMVRVVQPFIPSRMPLDRLVEIADKQFEYVARHCGAQVVGHDWGLVAPPGDSLLNEYLNEFVPRDHILVARVDVVQNSHPLSAEQTAAIRCGHNAYLADSTASPLRWYDGSNPDQYVEGEMPGEQIRQVVLVDIEPRLARPLSV